MLRARGIAEEQYCKRLAISTFSQCRPHNSTFRRPSRTAVQKYKLLGENGAEEYLDIYSDRNWTDNNNIWIFCVRCEMFDSCFNYIFAFLMKNQCRILSKKKMAFRPSITRKKNQRICTKCETHQSQKKIKISSIEWLPSHQISWGAKYAIPHISSMEIAYTSATLFCGRKTEWNTFRCYDANFCFRNMNNIRCTAHKRHTQEKYTRTRRMRALHEAICVMDARRAYILGFPEFFFQEHIHVIYWLRPPFGRKTDTSAHW